ncbi:helix-turn-helix domain-containing protein [Streptomyces yangpuensis]|uniref:Helix-turn-helix domain-containing protein n=1 Tax=Streptomyces yangpuensis TaxID=1648182 RepID=A0ABY5Q140_9ACTN|nr:helix-turn-helix transcriptional regulator [Streptomyces yangpuensis]UUY50151.1 helix-turn-helix domain-containing protein [Streptomyces yangpuensis]
MTTPPPAPNLKALHLELSRLRAARGWTYDQLAERSGLARRTLIEIEQGRTVGSIQTWHRLAHALGTPIGEIFEALCHGHEPPAPSIGGPR